MTQDTVVSKSDELRDGLRQFYGTEHYYRMTFSRATYTDGVKWFAETAGAYWFLDIVATELIKLQDVSEFLNIVLSVKDGVADINVDDGNDNKLYHRHIDFTDCPEGSWQFYLTNSVMLLPSEY